jgi:hypothetical protein
MWQPGNNMLGSIGPPGQPLMAPGGGQPAGWAPSGGGAASTDVGVVYDTYLLSGSRQNAPQSGPKQPGGGGGRRQDRGNAGGRVRAKPSIWRPQAPPAVLQRTNESANTAGRRQKNYRRLWEQIKSVGRGDGLDADGRQGMPGPELSVEELVRMVSRLPPDAPCIPVVAPSLQYLDSRAFAAFMKDLAKNGHVARAMELFDWIKDLGPTHELSALADVYSEFRARVQPCQWHATPGCAGEHAPPQPGRPPAGCLQKKPT